jgi:ABC-type multidrug transport system fused ATPase/permease subunit
LSQEPNIFDGTIIENLTYALDETPPKEKLEEVIKLAKCEFIYDFPNKLETEI